MNATERPPEGPPKRPTTTTPSVPPGGTGYALDPFDPRSDRQRATEALEVIARLLAGLLPGADALNQGGELVRATAHGGRSLADSIDGQAMMARDGYSEVARAIRDGLGDIADALREHIAVSIDDHAVAVREAGGNHG